MLTSRIVAGVTALGLGVAIIGGVIALDGFAAAAAGQELLDRAEPSLTDEAVSKALSDLEALDGTMREFDEVLLPAIDDVVDLETEYPAIAAGLVEGEATVAFALKAEQNLDARQQDFRDAQNLPLPGVPLAGGPIIAVVLGVVLLVGGGLVFLRPELTWPLIALTILGAVMLVVPLLTGMVGKASGAQELVSSLNISEEVAVETRARFDGMEALAIEYESELLPELPEDLGMTEAEVSAWLAESAPALASLSPGLTDAVRRFDTALELREGGIKDFQIVKDKPIDALPWMFIVPGALLLGAAGTPLILGQRAKTAPPTPE